MSWVEVEKINSWAKKGVPLNHLIWLNDYKTYGEDSYVFQNKDILHELYSDPVLLMDCNITYESLDYIFANLSESEVCSIIQKRYYNNVENLITNGVAFADATEKEILLLSYYHYYFGLDLSQFWSVGDKRNIKLSAMVSTNVGESQPAQTVEFAIAGFDHDNLTTAINGHNKAAVTLTQTDVLANTGYMNSTNTNSGGWNSCARRKWCNDNYYNALPSILKNIVKPVDKLTSAGGGSSAIHTSSDKAFLFSEVELLGTNGNYTPVGEGAQYEYYKTASKTSDKRFRWMRSPVIQSSSTSHFCALNEGGNGVYVVVAGTTSCYLMLGFCI